MFSSPLSSFRIIGLTRIFEVWKDNKWQHVSITDLENGHYILRIRYTDEDQALIDKKE